MQENHSYTPNGTTSLGTQLSRENWRWKLEKQQKVPKHCLLILPHWPCLVAIDICRWLKYSISFLLFPLLLTSFRVTLKHYKH